MSADRGEKSSVWLIQTNQMPEHFCLPGMIFLTVQHCVLITKCMTMTSCDKGSISRCWQHHTCRCIHWIYGPSLQRIWSSGYKVEGCWTSTGLCRHERFTPLSTIGYRDCVATRDLTDQPSLPATAIILQPEHYVIAFIRSQQFAIRQRHWSAELGYPQGRQSACLRHLDCELSCGDTLDLWGHR